MKGPVHFSHAAYLGGHPDRSDPKSNGVLVIDDFGFHMRGLKELFSIPWSEVVEVAIEGSEDAQKRLTATRLVTMGVFAFAAKKKSGTTYVGVRTGSYTCGFELEKVGAGDVRGRIARWTKQLPAQVALASASLTEAASASLTEAASPPMPERPTVTPVASVADELGKLAALRDQGVIND
jgi:hypothetical protein